MTPDLLSLLKDIHLPPPEPTMSMLPWYFLLTAVILILASGGYYYATRLKRRALMLLNACHDNYLTNNDAVTAAQDISLLLKRVALQKYPRHEVASLSGTAWINFLDARGRKPRFKALSHELLTLPWQADAKGNIDALYLAARHWIKEQC